MLIKYNNLAQSTNNGEDYAKEDTWNVQNLVLCKLFVKIIVGNK